MVGDNKEVFFDMYCKTCKYRRTKENDPEGACWDCLEVPVNQDSHKPINWKEDESLKKPGGKN